MWASSGHFVKPTLARMNTAAHSERSVPLFCHDLPFVITFISSALHSSRPLPLVLPSPACHPLIAA